MNIKPKRMNNRLRNLPSNETLFNEANRIYQYDLINGGLTWKSFKNPNHQGKAKLGEQVGGNDGHGYKMCMLLGHKFKVHQIVWLLNHNQLPDMPIDHKDRNKENNKIENLRLASDQQNIFNQSSNAKEFSGVTKVKNRYVARLQINGKKIFLGSFTDKKEAASAYKKASKELRGDFSPV